MDLPDAPLDFFLEDQSLVLEAEYRSGILLKPVRGAYLSVAGVLLDKNGRPLPWVAGNLTNREGEEAGLSFTDSEGRFEFYNLKPGTYTAVWEMDPPFVLNFELEQDSKGFTELGDFRTGYSEGEREW